MSATLKLQLRPRHDARFVATSPTPVKHQLEQQLAFAIAERDRLELELLDARAKAGDIEPPATIATVVDARIWLAWARANHHQAGCCCHRCPPARKLAEVF